MSGTERRSERRDSRDRERRVVAVGRAREGEEESAGERAEGTKAASKHLELKSFPLVPYRRQTPRQPLSPKRGVGIR
jgi:hypothetical protein